MRCRNVKACIEPGMYSAKQRPDGMKPHVHESSCDARGGRLVRAGAIDDHLAARIARKLISLGFHPVRPLLGGIHAWQEAGYALERP